MIYYLIVSHFIEKEDRFPIIFHQTNGWGYNDYRVLDGWNVTIELESMDTRSKVRIYEWESYVHFKWIIILNEKSH